MISRRNILATAAAGALSAATARAAGPTVVTGIPLTEFRTHMRTATKAP